MIGAGSWQPLAPTSCARPVGSALGRRKGTGELPYRRGAHRAASVSLLEGDSSKGEIDAVLPVGTTDASGFWTNAEDAENGENGENGTVSWLLVEGFSGALGDDLDTNDDGTFDSTPWTRIVDDVAVFDGGGGDLAYASVVVGPDYDGVSSFDPGGTSRIPNGVDTDTTGDWVRTDFSGFGFSRVRGLACAR